MLGYSVGAFALVFLLSALNGFERVIFDVYKNYYPDLKAIPVLGKTMEVDSAREAFFAHASNIKAWAGVLEENAVVQNGETQVVALVKGVPAAWSGVVNTDSLVVVGDKALGDSGARVAWLGEALLYKLNVGADENSVNIMAPRRESVGVAQMDMLEQQVRVSAMIRPGDELSHKLLIIPMALAEELFERYGQVSSYEISVKDEKHLDETQEQLQKQLGSGWKVQTRIQQNQAIYKMFNSEKWVAFAMVAFVLLLISFNLIGSLSMLVLEKKRDIRMLKFMGAQDGLIRRIFYNQGLLAAMSGTGIGLGLGILAVWLQDKYGYITTSSTFINAYPVELRPGDLLLIFGLCAFLGISGALLPALKSTEKLVPA